MEMYFSVVEALRTGFEGYSISNKDNGRKVEVAFMAGGKYLLWDGNEVAGQTDSEDKAYKFLMG